MKILKCKKDTYQTDKRRKGNWGQDGVHSTSATERRGQRHILISTCEWEERQKKTTNYSEAEFFGLSQPDGIISDWESHWGTEGGYFGLGNYLKRREGRRVVAKSGLFPGRLLNQRGILGGIKKPTVPATPRVKKEKMSICRGREPLSLELRTWDWATLIDSYMATVWQSHTHTNEWRSLRSISNQRRKTNRKAAKLQLRIGTSWPVQRRNIAASPRASIAQFQRLSVIRLRRVRQGREGGEFWQKR